MNETSSQLLLADMGGTCVRFALAMGPGYNQLLDLKCADFANLELAIDFYLHLQNVESISGETR